MTQLQYIPLKSARGEVAGYALVKDGFIEVRPKAGGGAALVLTENGSQCGQAGVRMPLDSTLMAVALADGAQILASGAPRGKCPPLAALARIAAANAAVNAERSAPSAPKEAKNAKSAGNAASPRSAAPILRAAEAPRRASPVPPPTASPVTPPAASPDTPPTAPAPEPVNARARAQREPAGMQPRADTPHPAWDDAGSLAAITRRAEEAFARMERRSREAKAAIEAKHAASEDALQRAVQQADRSASTEAAVPGAADRTAPDALDAPTATDRAVPVAPLDAGDGIEAILRALQARNDPEPAPLPRVAGRIHASGMPGGAINAPDAADAPNASDTSGAAKSPAAPGRSAAPNDPVWRALFSDDNRESPPVFSAEPPPDRAPVPNPFPHIFPNASFIRVQDDPLPHLEGTWMRGAVRCTITAVPGSYSPAPPAHLAAFSRFIRARSGGYWVLVQENPENDA